MKRDKLFLGLSLLCLFFALSGCISISNTPNPRFYTFTPIPADQASESFNMPAGIIIGIGPLQIPEYLNRPQIVTEDKNKMLIFAQFDRWGESLDLALERLTRDNLAVMLKGANCVLYPWSSSFPVKYQVLVDVIQLDSQLDKDLFFIAQWSIVDAQNNKMILIKNSEFRQAIEPNSYAGLTKALSSAIVSLSTDIARALSVLPLEDLAKDKQTVAKK